jgi:hypothetical protein
MARGTQQMKRAEELRDRLKSQIADLQKQLEGVEMTIRVLKGEPERETRATRSNVKAVVLALLEESGANGLNAASAVDAAAKRGEKLERATVSSLLSRLKGEGIATFDGSVYRLKQFGSSSTQDAVMAMH